MASGIIYSEVKKSYEIGNDICYVTLARTEFGKNRIEYCKHFVIFDDNGNIKKNSNSIFETYNKSGSYVKRVLKSNDKFERVSFLKAKNKIERIIESRYM